jgi:hypothetical protein
MVLLYLLKNCNKQHKRFDFEVIIILFRMINICINLKKFQKLEVEVMVKYLKLNLIQAKNILPSKRL